VEFDDDVRLDTSQVSDRRGMPGGRVAIGGGVGVIGLILALLLGVNPFDSGGTTGAFDTPGTQSELAQDCRTGADANTRTDCRVVGVINSVQSFWTDDLGRKGQSYEPAETVFFSGSTQTGCGAATEDVGPFYCPVDKQVYIDLGFYKELHDRFGAKGGPFAEAYVIAHEYGHHVQDLEGTLGRAQSGATGASGGSVRTELQADCYAGVWAHGAVSTGYITQLTDTDIADGLDAAAAVGDDRIQRSAQGRVDPESFTHGTSAQRVEWFRRGFDSGDPNRCTTFSEVL
jgi:predicted metalloprotease